MVSGGTYGTEDIVHGAGYGRAILILIITPLLWSLPTAFMIGELSSALPFEGGYYAWVRRAMGNFWGFQEAWLSLVASIFDMAIYPTLFVTYLTRMFPYFQEAHRGLYVGMAVVIACAVLNIAGVKVVSLTSLWLFLALSAPFVAIVLLAPFRYGALVHAVTKPTVNGGDILTGLLVCMWNYMGWDNASTVAKAREKYSQEAERYKHDKEEIQSEARKLEDEVAMEEKRADRYDLAEVFLDIGLVITSITLLSGRRIFWHLGIVFGVLGLIIAVMAAMVH